MKPRYELPDLMEPSAVANMLAHGTSDHAEIGRLYYSHVEGQAAFHRARSRIDSATSSGVIRAFGRLGTVRYRSASSDWRKQRYGRHSSDRVLISADALSEHVIIHGYGHTIIRTPQGEYTDVLLSVDDCIDVFGPEIRDKIKKLKKYFGKKQERVEYRTEYLDVMDRAIAHFEIADDNQPLKKILIEWFLSQSIAGRKMSQHQADMLATFVRRPEAQVGGLRRLVTTSEAPTSKQK